MALAAGTRLGSSEILSAIGAGGLGEVYAAPTPLFEVQPVWHQDPATFATHEYDENADGSRFLSHSANREPVTSPTIVLNRAPRS